MALCPWLCIGRWCFKFLHTSDLPNGRSFVMSALPTSLWVVICNVCFAHQPIWVVICDVCFAHQSSGWSFVMSALPTSHLGGHFFVIRKVSWAPLPPFTFCDKYIESVRTRHVIIINPLTRVVGAPQMILQPVFFHFSLFSTALWDLPNSRPVHCLMLSSHFFLCPPCLRPLSLCLARWFWPDLMNGKHDHTTAVCISLRSSRDLHVVQLPAGSWHGLPCW